MQYRVGVEVVALQESGAGAEGVRGCGKRQDHQVFQEKMEMWNFRGNLPIFKN